MCLAGLYADGVHVDTSAGGHVPALESSPVLLSTDVSRVEPSLVPASLLLLLSVLEEHPKSKPATATNTHSFISP
jgi:hypothetical protein